MALQGNYETVFKVHIKLQSLKKKRIWRAYEHIYKKKRKHEMKKRVMEKNEKKSESTGEKSFVFSFTLQSKSLFHLRNT